MTISFKQSAGVGFESQLSHHLYDFHFFHLLSRRNARKCVFSFAENEHMFAPARARPGAIVRILVHKKVLTELKIIVIIRYQKKGDKTMLIIAVLLIIFILFIICIMTITLSDTETFKAIDRKIANRIERKEKKK